MRTEHSDVVTEPVLLNELDFQDIELEVAAQGDPTLAEYADAVRRCVGEDLRLRRREDQAPLPWAVPAVHHDVLRVRPQSGDAEEAQLARDSDRAAELWGAFTAALQHAAAAGAPDVRALVRAVEAGKSPARPWRLPMCRMICARTSGPSPTPPRRWTRASAASRSGWMPPGNRPIASWYRILARGHAGG